MAKPKIKSTKGPNGYGLKSPWDFNPSDDNSRGNGTIGAGTYWGTGVKNPMGRSRDSYMGNGLPPKKLKIPPKKLA